MRKKISAGALIPFRGLPMKSSCWILSRLTRRTSIAESKGAIVKQEVFQGYIEQINRAAELASHNYVLSLDADEALDPELAESILKAKENFTFHAYRMNRLHQLLRKIYSSWQLVSRQKNPVIRQKSSALGRNESP